MRSLSVLFILTSIIAVLFNSISFSGALLLFGATLLSCWLFRKMPLRNNYAKYLVFFIVWVSAIFMPSFHLVTPIISSYAPVTQKGLNAILEFGIPLFFFLVVVISLFRGNVAGFSESNNRKQRVVNERIVKVGLVGCILLSIFCISTGIGRMGGEAIALPFHLTGIINVFRWTMAPFLFAAVIENYCRRRCKIPNSFYILFAVWCVLEIVAWMSKSVALYHAAPVLLVLLLYLRPSRKTILKVVVPVAAVFLFLYPIIEIMRNNDSGSLTESFSEARRDASQNEGNALSAPLNRAFMFGAQYIQDQSYISDAFFDFSRVPLLIIYGGAAGYQTFFIDGYPPEATHSSGTSGIMDPLLHGGKGLVYITFFIIVLLAAFSDNLYKKGYYSIFIILLLRLFDLTAMVNISSLYDSSGMQTIFVELLCIFIICRLNFRKVQVKPIYDEAY